MNKRRKLFRKLRDKEYREAFVSARVAAGVGAQIAALREKCGWNQEQLAQRADMKQPRIALLERGDYENFSFSTLKRLASAFGVAVRIDFVSFPRFLQWSESFNSEALVAPESFDESVSAGAFQLGVETDRSKLWAEALGTRNNFDQTQDAARKLVFPDFGEQRPLINDWIAPNTPKHSNTPAAMLASVQ